MSFLARTTCIPALVAASAMLVTLPSSAATVVMRSVGTATNTCQASLPAFEGLIRKRPLSLQNEGTATAFVTCALAAGGRSLFSSLYANSIDGQPHIITCTGIAGYLTGDPKYVTKSVIALANGEQVEIPLSPEDFGLVNDLGSTYISYSCAIPPGTGVNDTSVSWTQDVGA